MKQKFFTLAAVATMFAACTQSDEVINPEIPQESPMTVTAEVDEMGETRAGYDANNLPATFYLTVTQAEDGSTYNYTNVEMTKGEGSNYTPSQTLAWKDASSRSPFVSAYTINGTEVFVATDQTTVENVKANDLLGAAKASGSTSNDVTINGDQITINFRHLLCKLDVTYNWGGEFANSSSKSIRSVEYQGFGTSATLAPTTAAVTASTTGTIQGYVNGSTSEAIFAPLSSSPKLKIIAMIDDVERTFVMNVAAPTDGFAQGNRYTMNVTIGGAIAQAGEITISKGWETGDANGTTDGTTGNMTTN